MLGYLATDATILGVNTEQPPMMDLLRLITSTKLDEG